MDKRKEDYIKYLKSREWIEFRANIIKKRGKACEKCGKTNCIIHAHHLTYERIFVELESDIQLLCEECHKKIHNKKTKHKKPKSKKRNNKKSVLSLSPKEQALQQRRNKLKREGKLK